MDCYTLDSTKVDVMRFYSINADIQSDFIKLEREEAHHARVRRLRENDKVSVINGKGLECTGHIHFCQSGEVYVKAQEIRQIERASKRCILGVAVPECRNTAALVIKSAVELGITDLCLLITRYSGFRKTGNVNKFMTRWKKIMISACKQSGRLWLPHLPNPMELNEFYSCVPHDIMICVGWEPGLSDSVNDLPHIENSGSDFAWVVGPEGGWSIEDQTVIREWKPLYIQFGSGTLTTAVAVIAGLAALKTRFDGWL